MRTRNHPLKWPLSLALALLLGWGMFFVVPTAWIDALYNSHTRLEATGEAEPPPWLVLVPPPEILVEEPRSLPEPEKDPPRRPVWEPPADWWSRGVGVAIVPDSVPSPRVLRPDSLRLVLEGWRWEAAALAPPDSVLQQALALWKLQESYFPRNWKPRWLAQGRQWYQADLKSREADIFDEHLQGRIMAPRQGSR